MTAKKISKGTGRKLRRSLNMDADDYFSTLSIQQMIESLPKAKLPARFSNTAEHIL